MKTITVTLKDYPSEYWPVEATFKLNNVSYQLLFEDRKEAEMYFGCRFMAKIVYRDHRA